MGLVCRIMIAVKMLEKSCGELITPKSVPDAITQTPLHSVDLQHHPITKPWLIYLSVHLKHGLLGCLVANHKHNYLPEIWKCFMKCSPSCVLSKAFVESGCHELVPQEYHHVLKSHYHKYVVSSSNTQILKQTFGRIHINSACSMLSVPKLFSSTNRNRKTLRMLTSLGFHTHPALKLNITFLQFHLFFNETIFVINRRMRCEIDSQCFKVMFVVKLHLCCIFC